VAMEVAGSEGATADFSVVATVVKRGREVFC